MPPPHLKPRHARLRRIAGWTAVIAGMLWVFLLPVRLTWLINLGLRWTTPGEGLKVRIESAVFRWQPGALSVRLDIGRVRASLDDATLATADGIRVEVAKADLLRGGALPQLLEVQQINVRVDTTSPGWRRVLAAIATRPTRERPGGAKSLVDRICSPPVRAGPRQLRLQAVTLDYVSAAGRWRPPSATLLATLHHDRERARLQLEAIAGEAEAAFVLRGTTEVEAASGESEFTLELPPVQLERLPLRTGDTLPASGRVTVSLSCAGNLRQATLSRLRAEAAWDDGRLLLPARSALPVRHARLLVHATRAAGSGEFQLRVDEASLMADGIEAQLEAVEWLPGESPALRWTAGINHLAGPRLRSLLGGAWDHLAPEVRDLLAAGELRSRGTGRARFAREAQGPPRLVEIEVSQAIALAHRGHELALQIDARRAAGGISASVRVPAFTPSAWWPRAPHPLAAVAVPLRVDARVRLSPAGALLDAEAEIAAGRGRIDSPGTTLPPLEIHDGSASLAFSAPESRLRISRLAATTALGTVTAADGQLAATPTGLTFSGQLAVANVPLPALQPWLGRDALAPLKAAGIAPETLALVRAGARVEAALTRAPDGGGWQLAHASADTELQARVGAARLGAHARAALPPNADEWSLSASAGPFSPAALPSARIADVPLAGLAIPIAIELNTTLARHTLARRDVHVLLNLGAGHVQSAPLLTSPLRVQHGRLAAVLPATGRTILVSAAELALAGGVTATLSEAQLGFGDTLLVRGTAALRACDREQLLACWPADLAPAVRGRAAASWRTGKVAGLRAEFQLARARQGWNVQQLRAEFAATGVEIAAPGDMSPVFAGDCAVRVRWPAVEIELSDLMMAGAATRGGAPVRLGSLHARAELDGWGARENPAIRWTLTSADFAGLPLQAAGALAFSDFGAAVRALETTAFSFGRTHLKARWETSPTAGTRLQVNAPSVHVGEWSAVLGTLPLAPTPRPRSAATSAPAAAATTPAPFACEFHVGEAVLASDHVIRDLQGEVCCEHGRLAFAEITAREGRDNTLRLHFGRGRVGEHVVEVLVHDASAWLRTCTAPLRVLPLPSGELGTTIGTLMQVPTLISGGRIELKGLVRQDAEQLAASGSVRLTNATLLRSPRVLDLLAAKFERRGDERPHIRMFAIDDVRFSEGVLQLRKFTLDGADLKRRLSLDCARYSLRDHRLGMIGRYFGFGFEVIGTRANPQVYLRDNVLIAALGQRNELVFDDETELAEPCR